MKTIEINYFQLTTSNIIPFQKCAAEADAINVDENLLQLEITSFPTLQEMVNKMEPIEKLWKTAFKFDKCYEMWYVYGIDLYH